MLGRGEGAKQQTTNSRRWAMATMIMMTMTGVHVCVTIRNDAGGLRSEGP